MNNKLVELENGIKINVNYILNKDKPTLLFLHFGSGNLHMWNAVIPHFIDSFNIIIPDMRGHGKSSKPKKGYHIEDFANDLIYLLKEFKIKEYHIIGSSLGAEVGTVLTAREPKNVKSLVCEGALYNEFGKYGLIDGDKNDINKKIKEKLKEIEKRKGEYYYTKEEYLDTEKRFFQKAGFWNEYFEEYINNNVCKDNKGRYTSCYPIYVSKEYMKNYYHFNFEEYYKKIKCPILFLPSKSEWKNETIKNIVHEFGQMAGNYDIKSIKGFIHAYGWMKVPDRAADVVLEFINKIK